MNTQEPTGNPDPSLCLRAQASPGVAFELPQAFAAVLEALEYLTNALRSQALGDSSKICMWNSSATVDLISNARELLAALHSPAPSAPSERDVESVARGLRFRAKGSIDATAVPFDEQPGPVKQRWLEAARYALSLQSAPASERVAAQRRGMLHGLSTAQCIADKLETVEDIRRTIAQQLEFARNVTPAAPEERGTPFAELIELEKKATPGPWCVTVHAERRREPHYTIASDAYEDEAPGVCGDHSKSWPLIEEDAEFIVALRNAWPAILAALPPVPRARETESNG